MDKVTVYRDSAGEYRWKRQSENGRVVSSSSEGYTAVDHAVRMAVDLNQNTMVVVLDTDDGV